MKLSEQDHTDAQPGGRASTSLSDAPIPGHYGVRVAVFYAAIFLIYGVHVPYFPVWLDWRGLSAAEISAVMAAPLFVRAIISPALGFAADRAGAHRAVIVLLGWVTLVGASALAFETGWWWIVICSVVIAVSYASMMPLAEAIAVTGVRRAKLDYGRMRLWGSLSFIGASFATGYLIDVRGAGWIIWLLVAGAVATVVCAVLLPQDASELVTRDGRARLPTVKFACVGTLVRAPLFIVFLVATGSTQAAHATYYAFSSIEWLAQGLSAEWVGALWAIGVLAEVALFAFAATLFSRFSATVLLMAGAVAAILRWFAMAYSPPLIGLICLQLMHALTFGATHLATVRFIAEAVEERLSGTAQALAMVMTGIATGLATLLAGRVYPIGPDVAYLSMSVIACVSLVFCIVLWRFWDGRLLGSSQT